MNILKKIKIGKRKIKEKRKKETEIYFLAYCTKLFSLSCRSHSSKAFVLIRDVNEQRDGEKRKQKHQRYKQAHDINTPKL